MANWLRNVLKILLIAPLAVIFLSFDLANRQNVIISFDPFNSNDLSLPQVELPLFVVLIGAVMVGVVLGGLAVWMRQGRFRKQVRETRAKLNSLHNENDALRARLAETKSASGSLASSGTAVSTRSAA
jgi:uncharacterized integral membrane protein